MALMTDIEKQQHRGERKNHLKQTEPNWQQQKTISAFDLRKAVEHNPLTLC